MRRFVAIASAAVALLAMVAQPALAAGGHVSVQRPFALAGDRDHLRIDTQVVDTAAWAGVGLPFALGPADRGTSLGLTLTQGGTTKASRLISFDGYGNFKNVSGPGCSFESFNSAGTGVLSCRNNAFDWTLDRAYRMVVVRGLKNANGWLWKVSLVDLKTDVATKVAWFRAPHGVLSNAQHGPYTFSNPENCARIDRVEAKVWKPVASGSTVTWKKALPYKYGCSDATARSGLTRTGVSTFVIAT